MTTEKSPMKTVWMARAQAGFLRQGATCIKTRSTHALIENKTELGLAIVCTKCKAGLRIKRPRGEIVRDVVTDKSDLRQCCWMCGAPFSSPRTKDEYIEQLCAACLVALDAAGVLRIDDPRTREVGGQPPVSAHLRE